ncbi:hypothetical protein CDAR_88781 [Caerostris darwini]|uniref:Uncharacterized protein n=1 Tax=Caerostris darwini TaxID=1538125 RepID=A0AAV4RTV5_9ARAC|nr:hypothetical protein CDAR_88781 [Caerostris darwini]
MIHQYFCTGNGNTKCYSATPSFSFARLVAVSYFRAQSSSILIEQRQWGGTGDVLGGQAPTANVEKILHFDTPRSESYGVLQSPAEPLDKIYFPRNPVSVLRAFSVQSSNILIEQGKWRGTGDVLGGQAPMSERSLYVAPGKSRIK